jgi:hypothetical protein
MREASRLISGGREARGGSQLRMVGGLILVLAIGTWPIPAHAENVTLKIPAVKIPLKIKDQSITITASAIVSMHSKNQETSMFKLELTADLGELQQNITPLLASQLDKNDACGERIAIEHADLAVIEVKLTPAIEKTMPSFALCRRSGGSMRMGR